MGDDGFYTATRIVNPILMRLRSIIARTYGLRVLDDPNNHLHLHDVAIYANLEMLRDKLASNLISKEDYANEICKLLEKYDNISSQVYEILSELYTALTGKNLPQLMRKEAKPQKTIIPSEALEVKINRGICPRCVIEGDRVEKDLKTCVYCGELYCDKHLKPRITMTFNQYQVYLERYRDISPILREHWSSTDGHPCTAYTKKFWEDYHSKRREEIPYLKQKAPSRDTKIEVTSRASTNVFRKHQIGYQPQSIHFSRVSHQVKLSTKAILTLLWVMLAATYFALPWVIYYGEREIVREGVFGIPIPTGEKVPFEMKVTGFDFAVALKTVSDIVSMIGTSWHPWMIYFPIVLFAMLVSILAGWKWFTAILGFIMLYFLYDFYTRATTTYFFVFTLLSGLGSLGTVMLKGAQIGVGFYLSTLIVVAMTIYAVSK